MLVYALIAMAMCVEVVVGQQVTITTGIYSLCGETADWMSIKNTDSSHGTWQDTNHGSAVTGIGDLNLDGVPDLAVGAETYTKDNDLYGMSGAIYIYFLKANFSDPEVVLALADGSSPVSLPEVSIGTIGLGTSLANMGDLNGDGIQDLVAGTEVDNYNLAHNNRGSVWLVYLGRDGKAIAYDKIGSSYGGFNYAANGYGHSLSSLQSILSFGKTVENIGDLDGDGFTDLAIGTTVAAYGCCGGYGHQGSIWFISLQPTVGGHLSDGGSGLVVKDQHMFTPTMGYTTTHANNASILLHLPDLSTPTDYDGLNLAEGMTNVGDWNGDSVDDLVLSVFDLLGSRGYVFLAMLQNPSPEVIGEFIMFKQPMETHDAYNSWGTALQALPDIDGNGYPELMVGDKFQNTGGAVYVHYMDSDFSSPRWKRISEVDPPNVRPFNIQDEDIVGRRVSYIENIDGAGTIHMVFSATQAEGQPVYLIPHYECDCRGSDAPASGRSCEFECDNGSTNDASTLNTCDCTNSGGTGPTCSVTCQNGGWNYIGPVNYCDCTGTNAVGSHCQNSCDPGLLEDGTCNCFSNVTGMTGLYCDEDLDDCLSNPCLNMGVCQDNGTNSFECFCAETGYDGTICDVEFLACESSPCSNGGVCSERDGVSRAYDCDCAGTGYQGKTCGANVDECLSAPCFNGGACIDYVAGFQCNCTNTGYEGATCENNVDDCYTGACMNNGTCRDNLDKINKYLCDCPNGYEGKICEVDVDDCASDPCIDGVCVDQVYAFYCNCSTVFPPAEGELCDIQIDQCASSPCDARDTCKWRKAKGSYDCEALDPCLSYPCLNGDTCVSTDSGDFTCESAGGGSDICLCQHSQPCLPDGFCDCGLDYGGDMCELDLTAMACARIHIPNEYVSPSEAIFLAVFSSEYLSMYSQSYVEKFVSVPTGIILNVCVLGYINDTSSISSGGANNSTNMTITEVVETLKTELADVGFEEPELDNYIVEAWTSSGVTCETCVDIVLDFNLYENVTLEELVYDVQIYMTDLLNATDGEVLISALGVPEGEDVTWTLLPVTYQPLTSTYAYSITVSYGNNANYDDDDLLTIVTADPDSPYQRKTSGIDITVTRITTVQQVGTPDDDDDRASTGSDDYLALQFLVIVLLLSVCGVGIYYWHAKNQRTHKKKIMQLAV